MELEICFARNMEENKVCVCVSKNTTEFLLSGKGFKFDDPAFLVSVCFCDDIANLRESANWVCAMAMRRNFLLEFSVPSGISFYAM
jgi:hypothetical protein